MDYYPFGMTVPNRNYSSPSYRYGFNGMEKDDEIEGQGNSNTSFFRQFNLRLGRAFSLDPIQRAGQTMYSMMSNNPMIMIDPRGDVDYYNENGIYLYTDTKTSTDIRLITQVQFDKIQNNFAEQIADPDHSYINLIDKLETESRKVTIKVTGSLFKKMLKDSNLDKKIYDPFERGSDISELHTTRKEQAALFVLDTEKAEITLKIMDDAKSTAEHSEFQDVSRGLDGKILYKENKHLIVIGTIHTHPINGGKELFGTSTKVKFHDDDYDTFTNWGHKVPFFQLYPKTINEVDAITKDGYKDNFTTTKEVLKNGEKFTKKVLKEYGGKSDNK